MRHTSNGFKSTIQIGQATHRTALTVDTIRFYERRAQLPVAPRTTGQFRVYTADDISRLNLIKQMQPAVKPESAWSFEGGSNGTLADSSRRNWLFVA